VVGFPVIIDNHAFVLFFSLSSHHLHGRSLHSGDPKGKGVGGNFLSVSSSFNPACDAVDGRRVHEPGGSEGDFRMRSGAGKAVLNGEIGVMRRASNPA